MLLQEIFQGPFVPLADFSKHPSNCLMNEIFLVFKQEGRNLQRIPGISIPDKEMGADDRNAAVPKAAGHCKPVKQFPILISKVCADDIAATRIHQIPVVDIRKTGKIKAEDFFPQGFVGVSELMGQDQKRKQAIFVNFGFQQFHRFAKGHISKLADNFPYSRHRNTDKSISLGVLAFSCLEKPLKMVCTRRVRVGAQGFFGVDESFFHIFCQGFLGGRESVIVRRHRVSLLRPLSAPLTAASCGLILALLGVSLPLDSLFLKLVFLCLLSFFPKRK